jgi:putative flippase GtrA
MREFLRHQVTAIAATVVDYAVMILLVSLVGLGAVQGTVIGAACGGFTSFSLGRRWTFRQTEESAGAQALRYVVVSAASLLLNGVGEWLFSSVLGVQYVIARVITSLLVSIGWNYPLQRAYVFKTR